MVEGHNTNGNQSFLGMNLFIFDTGNGAGFTISKQFWVFVILVVPMTFITVGTWLIFARRRRIKRAQERSLQRLVSDQVDGGV